MNAAGTTLGEDDESGSRGDLKNFAQTAKDAFSDAAKAADNDDEENPGLKQTIAKMAEDAKNTLLGEDGKGGRGNVRRRGQRRCGVAAPAGGA